MWVRTIVRRGNSGGHGGGRQCMYVSASRLRRQPAEARQRRKRNQEVARKR